MDYTREPILETVITPKDGHRIAVRSSKNPGQEEFVVDALEVVSFGSHCFFRNLERPRAFMVPASDYEVLEVRESKLALKAATPDAPVRSSPPRPQVREVEKRKPIPKEPEPVVSVEPERISIPEISIEEPVQPTSEPRNDRRGDRRKGQRRRRGSRDEPAHEETRATPEKEKRVEEPVMAPAHAPAPASIPAPVVEPKEPRSSVSTIILPPPTLIRDDLERLRQNDQYKGAFYLKETKEEPKASEAEDIPIVPFNLQGEEEHRPEEPLQPEENIYKATPAPLDDEGSL